MRIKALFSLPSGEKVTEKALRRVLISSVCSMLLCMACLVGVTWAWFTVSVENTGNVITIAETDYSVVFEPDVPQTAAADGSYTLQPGSYTMKASVESNATADDFTSSSKTVYLIVSVQSGGTYYIAFPSGGGTANSGVLLHEAATFRFSLSWIQPENADPIPEAGLTVGQPATDENGAGDTSETTTPGETTVPAETTAPTETTAPSETGDSSETEESSGSTAETTQPTGETEAPEPGEGEISGG